MPYQKLTYALLSLISLQIIIGIMAIIFAEHYKHTIVGTASLTKHDEKLLQSKFILIQFYGIHICVIYSSGIPLIRKYFHNSYTNHLAALLVLWNFIAFITSIDGFVISWIIEWNINKNYNDIIEQSLYETIEFYFIDLMFREKWDNLQYNDHCCGVNNVDDWKNVNIADEILSKSDNALKPNLIPLSCCRQSIDCYEKQVIQASTTIWLEIQNVNLTAIHQNGCLMAIINRIENAKISIFILIGIVFVLQVGENIKIKLLIKNMDIFFSYVFYFLCDIFIWQNIFLYLTFIKKVKRICHREQRSLVIII